MKKPKFMKKIITLLTFLTFILSSCSSDNDDSFDSNIQIEPPNWIQGKWLLEGSVAGESGWKFTNNDFIIIQANTEVSQREQLQQFSNGGQDVSASDSHSDTEYTVTLNSIGGQTTIYSFSKISDSEITWENVSNSSYKKQ